MGPKISPWVHIILTKVHLWVQGILNKILLCTLLMTEQGYVHAPVLNYPCNDKPGWSWLTWGALSFGEKLA